MKWLNYIILFFSVTIFAQEQMETSLINQKPLIAQQLISIDNFGTSYKVSDNTFYKTSDGKSINFSAFQLGEISSANTFNPLKINLFYKDFNTVIILDNRLAEIFKIDFNTIQPYKNITHISTGHDNTLWIFNQDTQQLEVYDYLNNNIRASTLPIQSEVIDIGSNYNYCWLLTKKYIYVYNYFGSIINKIENKGFQALTESNGHIILQKDNRLFILKKGAVEMQEIKIPELLINQFLLTNESLYIYDDEILHKFQLKIK